MEFANIAAERGLDVLKGYVPIDTETLKDSIRAQVVGGICRLEVPNEALNYTDKKAISAKKLALVLEIGLHPRGGVLHRTQDNTYAPKGSPTAGWFYKASMELKEQMLPIAKDILTEATRKAIQVITTNV